MILGRDEEIQQPPRRRRLGVYFGGCLLIVLVLLLVGVWSGWYYLGTEGFAEFVRKRVERNLESRFGRDVTIERVRLVRSYPARIFIEGLRIANAPGGVAPEFGYVQQIEIVGGIESFLTRTLDVGNIYVRGARIHFEVYPEEHALEHNWPRWKRAPRRPYTIYRMELDKLYITGGAFFYNDLRRDMRGQVRDITSEVTARFQQGIYQGVASAPALLFQIQDYEPVTTDMRASFYYQPGSLDIRSVALRGRGVEAFVSGKLDPITEVAYDLGINARMELARVREIFRVERPLTGPLSMTTRLIGQYGKFTLTGDFSSPEVLADVYQLAAVRGSLNITGEEARIRIASAEYGGGELSANYHLTRYAEPYPMSVDLDYRAVSIEKLFEDWGVRNLGLRGAATGSMTYAWEKDRLLEGRGKGNATLQPGSVAFGEARYPMRVSGTTNFALNRGVIAFGRSSLRTPSSTVDFSGTFGIESQVADLNLAIRSSDFAEIDRLGANIADSAGQEGYELLGLGGSGTITGTLRGPLNEPSIVARIAAQNGRYNNVLLGDGEIDLRYDGRASVLTFDRAQFRDGNARIAMTGTIRFPDQGPGPLFDLRIVADGYSVERALAVVELDLSVRGIANGVMVVRGTPEDGTVTFENMRIAQNGSQLRLNGDVAWAPGEGNVTFDLDIGADSFPVAQIAEFFEFGELPVTGLVTGTMHIEGHRTRLEGAGSVIVREGAIMGEPIDLATADIVFTEGLMRATHVEIRAPAGVIIGEAEINLADETFSYVIRSSQIDPTQLTTLRGLSGIFTGTVILSSSGAGSFTQPELVIEAYVPEGTLFGTPFPEGEPAPQFYLAIRNGQLIVRGSAFGLIALEGNGFVEPDGDLDGLVQLSVSDLGRLLRTFAPAAEIPAEGNFVVDVRLGGNISALERIEAVGTFPLFDLTVAGQPFTIGAPAQIALRDGRIHVDSFTLARDGATFSVDGSIPLAGAAGADLRVKGQIDASLLQLFMPDARVRGRVIVDASITGSLQSPRIVGTADLSDGQLRLAGFPQLIDQINGRIIFSGQEVELRGIRATVGGGRILAGARLVLDGLQLTRMSVTINGTDVALRYFDGVTLEGDFNLVLSGDLEQSVLQGEVLVDRGVYSRDFDPAEAVLRLLLERRGLQPAVAASWQNNVRLRLSVSAPGTLAVRNNIAEITGSADFEVTGTLANPVLIGDVDVDEGGRIRIQDVDYRVTRGSIAFQNPFRIDPFFDITAEGRVQEYFLTVNLSGTMDRIHTSITSDPPISELSLLSLLGPGTLGQQRPGGILGADSLQRAGTSLLYSSVGGLIGRRILPFTDSFRFDAGLLEGSASPQPTVTFEEWISRDVRVIVVYNTADHTKDRQIIEWQATPNWVLQFTRAGDEEYILDARFRRRYNGYWGGSSEGTVLASTTARDAESFLPPSPPAVLPPAAAATARQSLAGLVVTEIAVRSDSPYDAGLLAPQIPLNVGEPLTIRGLQTSISRLYATGDFQDIRVDGAPHEGGVALTFVVSLNYRIREISVVGAGRNRQELQRRVQVRVGEVLSLSRIDRSADAVASRLADLGYLEATVDPETRFSRETNSAEVIFHVEPGQQAQIASVRFEGDTAPFTADQLIGRMRLRPGSVFRRNRATDDAGRMMDFLARQGRRRARVEFVRSDYDAETNRVDLLYNIEVGPVVEVEVEGVPQRAVRRWLPLRRGERYSRDTIESAADRIIAEYQRRGHFRIAVDVEERSVDDRWIVTFKVQPGERYRLDEVTFAGNRQVSDSDLRDVISTSRVGGFRRLLGTLFRRDFGVTQAQLDADRDALEAYYRLSGFTTAVVERPAATTSADGTLDVQFTVREGARTIVQEVLVEGAEQFRIEQLPDLRTEPGEPLNPQTVAADIVALQSFYADRGYVELQVSPHLSTPVEVSPETSTVTVTLRIAEGPQVRVDEVTVRGNTFTKSDVILRSARLQTGEPFTYRSMLSAQRDLYRLGTFRRAEVLPQAAGTAITERDVVIEVEEGQNFSTAGSLGYSTEEGISVSASVAHRNLFGTARYLGLETRLSEETHRYFLTFREPFTFKTNIPTQITLFRTREETRPGATFESRGMFLEASRVAFETTRWALRYEYKIADCVAGRLCEALGNPEQPIIGLPLQEQEIEISSLTPSWFWDRRDDPFTPRRGFFASASLEYAFPLLAADANFLKGFTQGAWYRPLGARSEIVLSSRIGLINRLGPEVPFSERFVAGGETSHRAFDRDELGIEGQTLRCFDTDESGLIAPIPCSEGGTLVVLGGNALALINAEYRFPIFGALRGAFFVDAGNVWSEIREIDFSELRYGAGVGVRYLTPVGPLRIDFGYKLDREPWEDRYAFTLTIGYPF
jgi:outer membrane protein insertion porin family